MKLFKIIIYILSIPLQGISFCIPKNKNLWIFGAWTGNKYADNSKYLFEYIHQNKKENIKAIWLTDNKEVLNKLNKKGKLCVMKYSLQGFYYSIIAKYLVNCVSYNDLNIFAYIFGRKSITINLWHGTPLKKLEIKYSKISILTRYFLITMMGRDYDVVISSSSKVTTILKKYFSNPKTSFIEKGQPRNDGLFSQDKKRILHNIIKENNGRIITYLPTFREYAFSLQSFSLFKNYKFNIPKLEKTLKKYNAFLIIKLHPRDEEWNMNTIDLLHNSKRIFFIKDMDIDGDIYPLLAITDILISDYSSVYLDFLIKNKPIIFSSFDKKEYIESDRGFYYDYNSVTPGKKTKDWDEINKEISSLLDGYDPYKKERRKTNKFFNTYSDSNNSKRVFNAILNLIK